jgi:hypothetical protein
MNAKKLSAILVLMLAAIAAVVLIGLALSQSMWAWIIAYWAVLTVKNVVDYKGAKDDD